MGTERAKIGLLMIGAERFRPLGNGTKDGNYEERKAQEAKTYLSRFRNFADVVYPATVYSREGAETAAAEFYKPKGGLRGGNVPLLGGGLCMDPLPARAAAHAADACIGRARFALHHRHE